MEITLSSTPLIELQNQFAKVKEQQQIKTVTKLSRKTILEEITD